MTRDEINVAVGKVRAARGLDPVADELRAWITEARAEQGLPPEPSDAQLRAIAAIVAGPMVA